MAQLDSTSIDFKADVGTTIGVSNFSDGIINPWSTYKPINYPAITREDYPLSAICTYRIQDKQCQSDKVNKWSKWKPIVYATVSGITEQILKSQNYGFTIPYLSGYSICDFEY
jgi:hypothetical protein